MTRSPCRVITTSVDATQLEGVLWGEIRRFIQTAKYPLTVEGGGPLVVNHLHLRQSRNGVMDGISYCVGRVAAKGEGMLGHHVAEVGDGVPRTLFIADEASGVDDVSYKRAETWARRKLIIGNPYPCENFFKKGVTEGDLKSRDGKRYYRKVIRITGHDSPNVRLSKYNLSKGLESNVVEVPGVLPYDDYIKRLETWDPIQISVGIEAEFYEGAEVQLFPPSWLEHSLKLHELLLGRPRQAKSIGVDPAEGGDSTSWCAIDELGIIEILSKKTPDTQDIVTTTLAFMSRYNLSGDKVVFDSGGGGRQIADQLRRMGHGVRTVAFGEAVVEEPKRGLKLIESRIYEKENRVTYKNRRAQMYGELRERMNPSGDNPYGGFAIPKGGPFLLQYDHGVYDELRHQLRPIPLMYDSEGKLKLPPKNKASPDSKEITLTQLIGHSPDEADALVLALHGLLHTKKKATAGAGRR